MRHGSLFLVFSIVFAAVFLASPNCCAESHRPGSARGPFDTLRGMLVQQDSGADLPANIGTVTTRRTSFPAVRIKLTVPGKGRATLTYRSGRAVHGTSFFQGTFLTHSLRESLPASGSISDDGILTVRILESTRHRRIRPFEMRIDTKTVDVTGYTNEVTMQPIASTSSRCGTTSPTTNGTVRSRGHAASTSFRVVDVYAEGDSEFFAKVTDPVKVLVSTFNDTEVLYARDLGIIFNLTVSSTPRTLRAPIDFDPDDFEVNAFKQLRSELADRTDDIVFLVVGTKPTNFVGIADQIGSVCSNPDKRYALGWYYDGAYLTVAHEIGHLFGAEHYNVSPQGIMAGGADAQLEIVKFVPYSVNQITSHVSSNSSCLTAFDSDIPYGTLEARRLEGLNVEITATRFGSPIPYASLQGMYRADSTSVWLYYGSFVAGSDGRLATTLPSTGQYMYAFQADNYNYVASNIIDATNGSNPGTNPGTPSTVTSIRAALRYVQRKAAIVFSLKDSTGAPVSGTFDVYYRKSNRSSYSFLKTFGAGSSGGYSFKPKKLGQYYAVAGDDRSLASTAVTVRTLRR